MKRRVNTLSIVLDFKPMGDLAESIREIGIIGEIDVFVLQGSHESFRNAILHRFAFIGHANMHASGRKQFGMQPG